MSAKKLIFCALLLFTFTSLEAGPAVHEIEERSTSCSCSRADILGNLTTPDDKTKNQDYIPPANCKQIQQADSSAVSGLYKIRTSAYKPDFTVFCDMDLQGGGWTVILRHINDDVSFNREWIEYRNGFGNLRNNFWLGLENIKQLTDFNNQEFELYIGLENHDTSGDTLRFAWYDLFRLGPEVGTYYKLELGSYTNSSSTCGEICSAGDSFSDHNNNKFSTPDNDNDNTTSKHCAMDLKSGWWYRDCHQSHLTGKWFSGGYPPSGGNVMEGIIWKTWREDYSFKTAVMAVRPK